MVFLPRKRRAPQAEHQPRDEPDGQQDVAAMVSLLADAGCTLLASRDGPPSLPADPHKLRRLLEPRLSSDPALLSRFLSGFSSFVQSPLNLSRVLIPASRDGGPPTGESLARALLLVSPLQPRLQQLLLEKLPEHFDSAASAGVQLKDDVARLIIGQFRWLDFLVDPEELAGKLMEVLSIAPLPLKKEIIGSLPEIVGDRCHPLVVPALERLLQEESEVVVPVLDAFSNLNLDNELQEQAVTIALSCIRTVDGEHMPHLLRFLLLSAMPANIGRIISQIREQLKFVGATDYRASMQKNLKGKSLADSTEASILEALRSSLRFKNILCEAILKELKSLHQPRDHKVIDVWFVMLIYMNGGLLQKSAEKILKKKIIEGCFCEALFDQCIHGHRELVKDYFASFLSICECLLTCREQQARDFGIYLYTTLFKEFSFTYSRQEILGALVTHIGSGISYEVSSALEAMILLTSKYSAELIPISSHINGILDYLEGFHEENLHKVYEVFCHLALSARSMADTVGCSIANELLMIVRKQVGNPDMKYRKMGIIGTLKIVCSLGGINADAGLSSSEKTNSQEALDLLKISIDSCKSVNLPLILLYDELVALLDCNTLQPAIIEWLGKHVGEFESMFLSDLERGQLPVKDSSDTIEGELWMNLDGDLSPVCVNILPLISSSSQQSSTSLQILPSQFSLLSVIERITNQGSLGGIDALLGCPLHLPSHKLFFEDHWKMLTAKQKEIVCFSLYYAINWMRELLNAFSTQVAERIDIITQATKGETVRKLFKRLRNLILMESLLNNLLKGHHLSLPDLHYYIEHSGYPFANKANLSKQREKKTTERISQRTSLSNTKKRKLDSMASKNLDHDGKLRQPTIVDALKRAGVATSQEVQKESSSGPSSNGRSLECKEKQKIGSNEFGLVDISSATKALEAQRSRFRSLHVGCLSLLSFSQSEDTCCPDPAAELPLHLYLLRDLHSKLDDLNTPGKHFLASCSVKLRAGYCRITASELLSKTRPLFTSLRKHLDSALSLLQIESETCPNHWKFHSTSAGSPDIPDLVVSNSSIASAVFREVLCCYSKMVSLPDLFIKTNLPVLREILETFQPIEKSNLCPELQPGPTPGSTEYLFFGVYSLLESILQKACSFSFFLASEVLVTMQSLVTSVTMFLDHSAEGNGKTIQTGSIQRLLPFMRRMLGLSAHKLLVHDWDSENNENDRKSKVDIIQKTLQIYLKYSDSTSDLLDELACSILPQVPSCRNINTQEAGHGFPTLCPTMFLTWYRVLNEENVNILNKLVKEVRLKSKADMQGEDAKKILIKLRQSVNVVVSLVSLCKVHDKVPVHAIAVKFGGKFVDTYLKVFDFLQAHFHVHNDIILQMVKELQKATRIIQTLCSEAKGTKRIMITTKIPATKRSMERFLFHVKALLHNTSNGCTFWMGNLKHKDLYGQVVSSQVYNTGDDNEEEENQTHVEADVADPADDRDQSEHES